MVHVLQTVVDVVGFELHHIFAVVHDLKVLPVAVVCSVPDELQLFIAPGMVMRCCLQVVHVAQEVGRVAGTHQCQCVRHRFKYTQNGFAAFRERLAAFTVTELFHAMR